MQYLLESKLRSDQSELSKSLAEEYRLDRRVADILVSRGVNSMEEARRFLQPKAEDLHEPFGFADMKKAVSLIGNAVAQGQKILIHGDYDADGTTGSALLLQTLQRMGGNAIVHLPSRSGHGYGLAMKTVEQHRDCGLLITVDCGISNVQEIARARELGMRTIVTDHHLCPEELPEADCILDPKRPGETYPFKDLCGAGVAFKLAQALRGSEALRLLDLAAVGTIADMVPLTGENRTIAALGLERFRTEPNLGLGTLFELLKGPEARLDAEGVAFSLAPCINAAGRLSTAKLALDLMTAPNAGIARVLAQSLLQLNSTRQRRQQEIARQVDERLSKMERLPRIIVLYDDEWETGLVGLAAGRVAEKLGRPALLLGRSGSNYVGSARSAGEINIYEVLASVQHLLIKFGGHSAAAGLTVGEENLEQMRLGLEEYMRTLKIQPQAPRIEYDLELQLPADADLLQSLSVLEPCGFGNPKPEVLVRQASLENVRPLSEGSHSAFVLRTPEGSLDAVAFRTEPSTLPAKADAAGTLTVSSYTGQPQMVVSALSYPDPAEIPYLRAVQYVLRASAPRDAANFFCGKEKLGRLYSAFSRIIERNGPQSCASLHHRAAHVIPGLTRCEFAFALGVFGELKLLQGIRNARIEVTPAAEKKQLEDSRVFRVFQQHAHAAKSGQTD